LLFFSVFLVEILPRSFNLLFDYEFSVDIES